MFARHPNPYSRPQEIQPTLPRKPMPPSYGVLSFSAAMEEVREAAKRYNGWCDTDVFAALAKHFSKEGTVLSLPDAIALYRVVYHSWNEAIYYQEGYRNGVLRMSAKKQAALWKHFSDELGFRKTEGLNWAPTSALPTLRNFSGFMAASMPRETVDAVNAHLWLSLQQEDHGRVENGVASANIDILRAAIKHQKIKPDEIVAPLLSLATSARVSESARVRSIHAISAVLDPNEKGGAGRLTVSHELAQSMMDFALYGVGSPPQFTLRPFLLDVLSKMESNGRMERPATTPDLARRGLTAHL